MKQSNSVKLTVLTHELPRSKLIGPDRALAKLVCVGQRNELSNEKALRASDFSTEMPVSAILGA